MLTVFDTIKDRLPISEVLASYITLIPSGRQLKAKCPFHSERSASFSVSPERGVYYCFGCGEKGDIFTFVEKFEGVDKKGALKILADKAGVELQNVQLDRESTDVLFSVLESVTKDYENEIGKQINVIDYLKERGINNDTIKKFRIGYAPDEWRFISNKTKNIQSSTIYERAGLIKKTEKGFYDRFRKRIMFPINDSSGRVVGFSGRLYPPDSESPKYLNSSESEIFQKSRVLFGFDKAKFAIRKNNFAVLVEGQIDCVLAHQYGFKNTVASSGTAVSESATSDPTSNLSAISRLTKNIFLAFDGDNAGQKALRNAAVSALSLGMNPKVVALPYGLDPADFLNKYGADGWKSLLKKSEHFIIHQLHSIDINGVSANMLVEEIKQRIFPFLSKVLSPLERNLYIEAMSKEIGITVEVINSELNVYESNRKIVNTETRNDDAETENENISTEERFMGFLKLYSADYSKTIEDELKGLSFEENKFIFPEIEENKMSKILAMIERDFGYLSNEEKKLLMIEMSKKIKKNFFSLIHDKYSRELRKAESLNDENVILDLLTKLQTLNHIRHEQT